MAYPLIAYYSGSTLVTVPFTYPPTRVAAYNSVAARHDNIASSGVRESILERIDNFLELNIQAVLTGADVAAWNAFMQFALAGGQFAYYPDAALAAFTTYWLESVTWRATYLAPGLYTFKLKFRQVVT